MEKMYTVIALLFLLVLVSGCIDLSGVFGSNVISVQQNTVQNGVRDIIVIKDIITIPNSPLLPDQQLLFSFIAENKDNLKNSNVVVDLFNAPTIRSADGSTSCNLYVASPLANLNFCCNQPDSALCDDGTGQGYCIGTSVDCPSGYTKRVCGTSVQTSARSCYPDQCGVNAGGCTILPGEEKQINFPLRTPRQDEIKNIKTDTKLDFKLTYGFEGTLTYLMPAISTDEIIKRQRSGDKTTLFTSKSYGSGPVQIDVELQGAPYMLSAPTGLQTDTVLLFTINNVGSGNIVNSQINGGDFSITFPPEFEIVRNRNFQGTLVENEKFVCNNNGLDGTTCVTKQDDSGVIALYKDQSRSSLMFTVHLQRPLEEPFRTFQVTSGVKYNYELRDSVAMTINPFQNV